MRIQLHHPAPDDERIIRKFIWYPKILDVGYSTRDKELKWLEFAYIRQVCWLDKWEDLQWENSDK